MLCSTVHSCQQSHQHSWEYLWSEALRPGLVAQRQFISVCFVVSVQSCHCPCSIDAMANIKLFTISNIVGDRVFIPHLKTRVLGGSVSP